MEIDIKKGSGGGVGYAFCQYASISSVVDAIKAMDGEYIGNSRVKLGFGKPVATTCVWVDGLTEATEKQVCGQDARPYDKIKLTNLLIHMLTRVSSGGRRVSLLLAQFPVLFHVDQISRRSSVESVSVRSAGADSRVTMRRCDVGVRGQSGGRGAGALRAGGCCVRRRARSPPPRRSHRRHGPTPAHGRLRLQGVPGAIYILTMLFRKYSLVAVNLFFFLLD